jgi:tRNA pseudouridine65 synthase
MPEPIPILHLDARIVVVDKPPGLLVHKTRTGADEDALLQRVRDQLGKRIYPVHRLDRAASGLIAYGLDSASAQRLQAGLQADDAMKEYLVLSRGLCPDAFESRRPLKDDKDVERDAHSEFVRVFALTETRVSLLRVRIHTGRYHQIRRHLAHLAHHVVGDTRYGKGRDNRWLRQVHGLPRMFLHAWRLDVAHPDGGRLSVKAPLEADLRTFLAGLPDVDPAALVDL